MDYMTFEGAFQYKLFYDFMIPHYKEPTALKIGPTASYFHIENPIFSLFLFVSFTQWFKC